MFLSALRGTLLPIFLLFHGLCPCFSEVIIQDFETEADFNSFWAISTWGITGTIQYSADNAWVDENDGMLVLKINASPLGTIPVCGEVCSKRDDFLYGSYRASIKICDISGSVIGWFAYKDGVPGDGNLHEVDVEYLTENLNQVHFTLHHDEYSVDHQIKLVSFDPTADFHEYRFDWYSDKVEYYIDSEHYATLTKKVPDAACSIMLNHWSKNLTDWGGPAPTEDTYMYIDYMHYYSDFTAVTEQGNNTCKAKCKPMIVTRENDIVDIRFDNSLSGWITINVFNMSGKKVKALADGNYLSGERNVQWDAHRETSGVYFFRVETRGGKQSTVFQLVK